MLIHPIAFLTIMGFHPPFPPSYRLWGKGVCKTPSSRLPSAHTGSFEKAPKALRSTLYPLRDLRKFEALALPPIDGGGQITL